MSQEKIYTVRIRGPFSASQRIRAGVVISSADGYVGPLTPEQLKAVKADEQLAVTSGQPDGENAANARLDQANVEAEKVVTDAIERAEAIVAAAQTEADTLIADARKSASEEAEKAKAEAVESAKTETEQIVAAAHKQAEDIVGKAKAEGSKDATKK